MSVWMHVAAVVRWDSMGWMMGRPWKPFVQKAFANPPEGSEGPLEVNIHHLKDSADAQMGSGSMNVGDVTISGDLRDMGSGSVAEVVKWFKDACDSGKKLGHVVRQAVLQISAEDSNEVTIVSGDGESWTTVQVPVGQTA